MSNEEMNKKMEFIVEQQAQFAADIEVMREVQAQDARLLKEQHRKLSDAVITVVGMVGTLTQSQAHANDRINLLAQAQTRTDNSFNLLAQAQARTEESLNILINVVDRHISGNGGSENRA
jgi:hypothetical protein